MSLGRGNHLTRIPPPGKHPNRTGSALPQPGCEKANEHLVSKTKSTDTVQTGRYTCLCGVPDANLTFDADAVRGETAYYLDRKTCEASFAIDAKRAAWLPGDH